MLIQGVEILKMVPEYCFWVKQWMGVSKDQAETSHEKKHVLNYCCDFFSLLHFRKISSPEVMNRCFHLFWDHLSLQTQPKALDAIEPRLARCWISPWASSYHGSSSRRIIWEKGIFFKTYADSHFFEEKMMSIKFCLGAWSTSTKPHIWFPHRVFPVFLLCYIKLVTSLTKCGDFGGPQTLDTNWLVNMRDLENKVEASRQERYKKFVPWQNPGGSDEKKTKTMPGCLKFVKQQLNFAGKTCQWFQVFQSAKIWFRWDEIRGQRTAEGGDWKKC